MALSSGSFHLRFGDTGPLYKFAFETIGVSAGMGALFASGSTLDTPSAGDVYVLEANNGTDLLPEDIIGYCTVQDLSMAAMRGASLTVLFLGLEKEDLGRNFVVDGLAMGGAGILADKVMDWAGLDWPSILKSSAKGMLVMGGQMNSGVGFSLTNGIGHVSPPGSRSWFHAITG